MHLNPQFKSNIFTTSIFLSNLLTNAQNNSFFWFSCIFTEIYSCVNPFSLHYLSYKGLCICFHPEVWFWVKEAPTSTLAPPDDLAAWCIQALKDWVSRYMQVRHSHMASLLSVYSHWGGEPTFYCTIYLLISFIACLLGSIYSINSVYFTKELVY